MYMCKYTMIIGFYSYASCHLWQIMFQGDSFAAALPAAWGPPADAGWPSCTCLHDVALLDGRVLEPAGLLLQVQSCVAERQAGDHVLGDPERALTDLHRVDFWLE